MGCDVVRGYDSGSADEEVGVVGLAVEAGADERNDRPLVTLVGESAKL